jgi:hypothetical protein
MNNKWKQNETSVCWQCSYDSDKAQSILTITRNAMLADPEPKRSRLSDLNLQLNQIRGKFCYNLGTSPHLCSPLTTPRSSATLISAVPGAYGQQLHPAPSRPCLVQGNSDVSPPDFRRFCFHTIDNWCIYVRNSSPSVTDYAFLPRPI